MLKYFVVLAVNLFIVYCLILFFIDNRILVKDPLPIARTILLFVLAIWICYNLVTIYALKSKPPESGLVYSAASKTKAYGLAFYDHIQPFKKELFTWSIVAVLLIFLGVITVGITGYIWLVIPEKLGWVQPITGDAAWPAAILMAILWPLLFPAAVLVKHQLIKTGHPAFALPGFWGVVVAGIIVLVSLIYLMNTKSDVS